MGYVVVNDFADLQDNGHVYKSGDIFPRLGADADSKRIAELKGRSNKIGKPLIAPVPEKPAPEKPKRRKKD